MKIAVDARSLSVNKLTGIGNFTLNALYYLSTAKPTLNFYLLSNRPFGEIVKKKLEKQNNIHFIADTESLFKNSYIWFSLRLPYLIRKLKPDCFWTPSVNYPAMLGAGIKKIITVHDLIYKDFKSTMSLKNQIVSIYYTDKSIKNADLIWAVSDYTKERIEHYYPKRKCKDILVASGIDFSKYQDEITKEKQKRVLNKLDLPEHFALFVGTLEPRKNLSFLLKLWKEQFCHLHLVIVGASGWKDNGKISKIISSRDFPSDKIHFTGYIDDEDLNVLYRACRIYISTSFNEGFGLPQLEALANNAVVISPNNSAMAEVVSENGYLVDGWEFENWKKTILKALNNPPCINENKLLKKYDWQNVVKIIIRRLELEFS